MESKKKKEVEMPGIEPGASHMRSERSTTELHPLDSRGMFKIAVLITKGCSTTLHNTMQQQTDTENNIQQSS